MKERGFEKTARQTLIENWAAFSRDYFRKCDELQWPLSFRKGGRHGKVKEISSTFLTATDLEG